MTIENKNLEMFLTTILHKNSSNISINDLANIKIINMSNVNKKTGLVEYNFEELKKFVSLEKIIIENSIISENDIELFKTLIINNIEFNHCIFENEQKLATLINLTSLSFTDCYHENFNYIKELINLESLVINSPYNDIIFDFEIIISLPLLKRIEIQYIKTVNNLYLNNIAPKLNHLFLLGVSLDDLNFLNYLPNDSNVLIDEEYINNIEVINNKGRLDIKFSYISYLYDDVD